MRKAGRFTTVLSAFAALAVLLLPLGTWIVWLSDPLYDSVFGDSLGMLPVSRGGRVMPLSSASADIFKSINGKSVAEINSEKASPAKWIWLLNALPNSLSKEPFMRTDNRDLQKLLGSEGRYYSRDAYSARGKDIESAARSADSSPYSAAASQAARAAAEYDSAASSFSLLMGGNSKASQSLSEWEKSVELAADEIKRARDEKRRPDVSKLEGAARGLREIRAALEREEANPNGVLRIIPGGDSGFSTPAQILFDRNSSPDEVSILESYAAIRDAVAEGNRELAFAELSGLFKKMEKPTQIDFFRVRFENFVNVCEPFFAGLMLSGFALAAFCAASLFPRFGDSFLRIAAVFSAFAIFAQFFGIAARVYIQMRPPVTNLYSSIVFAGACASALGFWFFVRRGIKPLGIAAATCGFISLLVATNLPHSGDTMGMMRAVLNSNFWLTVHVITIMVGYCGIFLAGFAAGVRLLANLIESLKLRRGSSEKGILPGSRKEFNFGAATGETARWVYAVLCFGLLFSFAGTMLGGFWADMSWGRFWGWDPKENGALMMVLWTAAIIHCRALKMCSDRIFLSLAVFGNIVAAWAWFGVNLLGIGLHSYGFMEGGWFWFGAFVICQLLLMPLCFIKYNGQAE